MASTNELLRDDAVHADVQLRKATAGVDAQVQQRLRLLQSQLAALLEAVNPFEGARRAQRQRTLQSKARKLIQRAYEDCYATVAKAGATVGRAQAEAAFASLEEHVP